MGNVSTKLYAFALIVLTLIIPINAFSQSIINKDSHAEVIEVNDNVDVINLSKPYTTYIIRSEIDLENRHWKIPSNSTVFFLGGSVKNGYLELDNTLLQGGVKLFNVSLSGTCANDELQLSWFNDNLNSDYSQNLQCLHDIAKPQAIIKIGVNKYLIDHPVIISKSIKILGNSTRSYKDLGEEMFGSTLHTTKNISMLYVTARMVLIEGVNFIGASNGFTNKRIRKGTSSLVKYSWTSSGKVSDCNFLRSHIGLELYHSGIATVENNNFALCNVGILADHSGDCNYINNYINTCDCNGIITLDDSNVTELNGIGILFKPGSGNSNIIGGKIEWNNKGIVNAGSSGITVMGVQFDYNKSGHIFYYQDVMQYDSGFNGNSIVGCRFLGTPGSQHIYIRYMTTTKMNVTGNFFTCSGRGAYDNNKEGTVGPENIFSIHERHLDDKYKNICSISFGANSYLNMKKLCYAKPQVNSVNDTNLIRIISSDCNLSTEGYMTIATSDITD